MGCINVSGVCIFLYKLCFIFFICRLIMIIDSLLRISRALVGLGGDPFIGINGRKHAHIQISIKYNNYIKFI
jgi:hypothetical protein